MWTPQTINHLEHLFGGRIGGAVTIYWQNPFGDPIAPWHNMIPGLPLSQRSNVLPTPTMHHGYVFDRWLPFCIFTELGMASGAVLSYNKGQDYLSDQMLYGYFEDISPIYLQELYDDPANMPITSGTIVPNSNTTNFASPWLVSPGTRSVPTSGGAAVFYVIAGARHSFTDVIIPIGSSSWIRSWNYHPSIGRLSINVDPFNNPDVNAVRRSNINVRFGSNWRTVVVEQRGGGVRVRFEFPEVFGGAYIHHQPLGAPLGSHMALDIVRQGLWLDPRGNPATFNRITELGSNTVGGYIGAIGWFAGNQRVDENTVFHNDTTVTIRWSNPAVHIPYWWRSTTIPLNFSNVPNDPNDLDNNWYPHLRRGAFYWNNDNRNDISVHHDANSRNMVIVQPRPCPDTMRYVAFYIAYHDWQTQTLAYRFDIIFVRSAIDRALEESVNEGHPNNIGDFVTSIMAHEIGHVVGLRDNPQTNHVDNSLMNHERNRQGIRRPTQFDSNNVNWIYR